MTKDRRGGYRKPTANSSNAVGGPGALSQRTDANATAPIAAPGGDYKDRKLLEDQVSDGGPLAKKASFPQVNIDAPTNRKFESSTEGTMVEGGLNVNMFLKEDIDILLDELEKRNQNSLLIAQLRNTRNTQKPFNI